jgi:hypothetical protein
MLPDWQHSTSCYDALELESRKRADLQQAKLELLKTMGILLLQRLQYHKTYCIHHSVQPKARRSFLFTTGDEGRPSRRSDEVAEGWDVGGHGVRYPVTRIIQRSQGPTLSLSLVKFLNPEFHRFASLFASR